MALTLHTRNIIRVIDNGVIVNCVILKMCLEHVVVKFREKQYKVPYHLIDEVIGHELLMALEDE
ncbi:MAG: hypothetical protein KC467_13235 [Marinomonas atlantica]|nr:hypothetical protein [Marinomonas atlantica]